MMTNHKFKTVIGFSLLLTLLLILATMLTVSYSQSSFLINDD